MTTTTEIKKLNDHIVAKVDGHDVTHGQLSAAFDAVKNSENWKGPINTHVKAELYAIYAAAVEFFTGTPLVIQPSAHARRGFLHVKSVGYYGGPCN